MWVSRFFKFSNRFSTAAFKTGIIGKGLARPMGVKSLKASLFMAGTAFGVYNYAKKYDNLQTQ